MTSTRDIIINYARSYEKVPVEDFRIAGKHASCSINVITLHVHRAAQIDTNYDPVQLLANLKLTTYTSISITIVKHLIALLRRMSGTQVYKRHLTALHLVYTI